jgi:hypothetical protein
MTARRLALIINPLAILIAGAARKRRAARHPAAAAPPSLRAARYRGVTGVPWRLAEAIPVTAPLPAGLRATFSLQAPAFYSP